MQFKITFPNLHKILFFFLLTISLSGCLKNDSLKVNKGDGKPIVLTTFTVLLDLAKNVAGERLVVQSITKPGSEIHTYQFTPSDLIKAENADVIIENGLGLESWIDKFTLAAGDVPRVVLSDGMQPLFIESDDYAGKPNPHAWMSPKRTIVYVDNLLKAFIEIDPKGKEIFTTNAEVYKNKLLKLDQELRSKISLIPKERRYLVTCEGAFSYLAKDYEMKEAYLWPVNSESQVTPRRMARLIETIKEHNIPTIFCESTVNAKAQKEVARESGASYGGDFYVDSLSSAEGPASTLLDLHRYNAKLIIKGLVLPDT